MASLLAAPQAAWAQLMVVDPASTDQLAAASNAAPLPLVMRNTSQAFSATVLWLITADTTGGASLSGAGDLDTTAPDGAEWAITLSNTGGQGGPTLTLGPAAGDVTVSICNNATQLGPNDYACLKGSSPTFVAHTASVNPVTPTSLFVDAGQTVTTQAQGLNGGVIDVTSVPITFSIVGPAAAMSPANTSSDMSFPASFDIQINPAAASGSIITVSATRTDVPNVPVAVFTYTVNDYQLIQVSPPDGTTAQAGNVVPLNLEMRRNGALLPKTPITWAFNPNPNNGSLLASTNTTTLADGTSSNGLTVGQPNPGSPPANIVVSATAFSGDPVRSRAIDFVIAPSDVIVLGGATGDGQSAPINTAFASPLGIRSTRNGLPDVGSLIDWSVSPAGAANLGSATTTTDANGNSTNTVTAGSTGGPFTVTATHRDNPAATFTFNLTALDKRLVKPTSGSGDGQTGAPNQPLAQPLVAVATLNGAPQSGVTVNWTVTGGDAFITGTTNPTDNAGRSTAQISFGPTASTVTVQAERADVPGEIQSYTLTAANSFTLEKPAVGSGDGQTGLVGQPVPERLIVIAKNNGVPAANVVVLWSVTGSATLSNDQTTTRADGSTSIGVTFGTTPGSVTVTATRADAPSAQSSFVLTSSSFNNPMPGLEKPVDSGDRTSAPTGSDVVLSVLTVFGSSPQPDVGVLWELVSGNAQVRPGQTISNRAGIATTVVTLGSTPGAVVVRAVRPDAGNAVQTYQLTAVATGGAILTILDGNGQSAPPGSTLRPLRVRLTSNGQPIVNSTIAWEVLSGSATLSGSSSVTDTDGAAQTGLVFGATPGPVQVRASAGTATVQFTLNVTGAGRNLRLVSGNRQSGPVGTRAELPIIVEVTDGNGAVLPDQSIEWHVVSGTATLDAPTTTTGADGRSSQGLRFGSTAGAIRLRARLPGTTPEIGVDIDATSFVPSLAIFSGNNQSGPVSTVLPLDLIVIISVPPNLVNSLAGVTVRWQIASGGGSLVSATSTTGVDGKSSNRLTLGPSSGANTVTASIDGGGSVTFAATATATAGPLTIVSGNSQTLPTATPSAPLVVELKTAAGQPVVGATLDWSAVNATFVDGIVSTTTDAQGRSRNVAKVSMPGAASLTVKVRGNDANRVVFTLNGGVTNIPTLNQPQQTVANAIDSLCPALFRASNLSPEQTDLLARCLELVNNAGDHPDQVETALQQMQQDVALAQANAALVTAATQFDNVKARIAALRSGKRGADFDGLAVATATGVMPLSFLPSSVVQSEGEAEGGGAPESAAEIGADFDRWGFFASGIIGRGQQDAGSVTPEYDFDTNGLTAGVDYRVRDNWFVGASLGYNQQDTDLTDDSGGIDTKGWSISGYTTWFQQNNWYVDGVLSFGSNDYDLSRRIVYDIAGAGGALTHVNQLAEASTGGDQLSAALSLGRDFQKGAWSYGPYLRGTYTRVEFDAYQEQLTGGIGSGLGLAVDSRALKSMTGVLGGKVTYAMSRDWGVLMPHAQLEWEHEFKDDPQRLVTRFLHDPTGTPIVMNGDAVDSDYYNIGLGLSALFPGGRSAFFYYEHLAGSEGLSQDNLAVGVRIEF